MIVLSGMNSPSQISSKNKSKTICFLVLIILFVFQTYSFGINNNIDFAKYTVREGLSENYVNCIFQDSKGFIWIGTNDGLNRFDGYDFKTYRYQADNPSGISSNLINSIAEDQEGLLWIGTVDEGICIFNPRTEEFSFLRNSRKNPNLFSINSIGHLTIDSNNNIWFENNMGLRLLEKPRRNDWEESSAKITRIELDGKYFSKNISKILEIGNGEFLIGTQGGLYLVSSDKDTVKFNYVYYPKTWTNYVRDIVPYKEGYIITYYDNLYYFTFVDKDKKQGDFTLISDIKCNKISLSSDGTLWCGSDKGLTALVINPSDLSVISKTTFTKNLTGEGLNNNTINCLFQDQTGLLWVGTHGGGINVFNPTKKKFKHFYSTGKKGSISSNVIRSIYEDPNNNLFIGTESLGINLLTFKENHRYQDGFSNLDFEINQPDRNEIFSFIVRKSIYSTDRLWVGVGYPHKIISFQYPDIIERKAKTETYDDLSYRPVYDILIDNDSTFWLASYLDGLHRVTENKSGLKNVKFLPDDSKNPISSAIIRSLLKDSDGNIWIGTDKGLNKLLKEEKDKNAPNFIVYQHDPKNDQSISHNYILPLFENSDKTIWVGTMGGGLNQVIPGDKVDNDLFKSYSTKDGLPNNVIKAIQEDKNGNLWMSSNRGLTKFNPKNHQIRNYDIHDGLQDLEFMEMSSCKRQDGEMLFGGINGFNAFYPEDIVDDTTQVKLVLTDFFLSHQRIPVGKAIGGKIVLSQSITQTKEIYLKHSQNSFALAFAALHYVAPSKNQYTYMLKGFDTDWVKSSSDNRLAQYTNLPFGKYLFVVKASNNDGVWTSHPLELAIIITPPFWLTWWAYCIYVLIALAILWFLRKYSVIRNKNKNELLTERFEKEKINELSQLKLRFFTNISHEFRTPLTLIIGYYEKFNQQWDKLSKDIIKTDVDVIGRNAQLLLRLINQLLDFRKFDQGKMILIPEEADIIQFTERIYESFKVLSGSQDIHYSFSSSTPSIIMDFDKEKMEKIIYNLLSNAFKFTPNHGSISIAIMGKDDHIEMQIKDTGEGIPLELQPYVFDRFTQSKKASSKSITGTGIGLAFAKGLIELHKGSIRFESEKNSGTTFFLTFPKKHAYTKPKTPDDIFIADTSSPALIPIEGSFSSDEIDDFLTETKTYFEGIKVLIIEDNEDLRTMIKGGLRSHFDILEAKDGVEGYELCLEEQPDVVISDVMMPRMNGYDLCRKIKDNEDTSHIPLILLTAKTSEEDQLRGFKEGADAYVSKPFSQEVLKAQITTILEGRKKMWNYFKEKIQINPQDLNMSNLDKKFLSQAIEFIDENISKTNFTVDQLAGNFRISEVTLNKKLKSLTGKTANSFIRSIRLKKATELLQDQFVSVSEITYQVGFNDLKYFRECFKKEFSMTPSEYRKKLFNHPEE